MPQPQLRCRDHLSVTTLNSLILYRFVGCFTCRISFQIKPLPLTPLLLAWRKGGHDKVPGGSCRRQVTSACSLQSGSGLRDTNDTVALTDSLLAGQTGMQGYPRHAVPVSPPEAVKCILAALVNRDLSHQTVDRTQTLPFLPSCSSINP